uniref:Uncharacterized protein n=1 Tax=Ditylenchus dipsaci TaxID=166011 RepID=A0A915DK62_9BILA
MAGLVKSPAELNQTPQPMPNFFGFPLFMGATPHPLSMTSLFNGNHLKEPMTSSPVKVEPLLVQAASWAGDENGMFPPVSSVPLLGSPLEAMLNLNFSLNLAQKKCSEAASTTTMSSSSSSNNNANEDCAAGGQSSHSTSTPSPSSSIQQPQPPSTTSEAVTPAEDLFPSSLSKQLGPFPLPFSPSEMAGLVKSPAELNQTPQQCQISSVSRCSWISSSPFVYD